MRLLYLNMENTRNNINRIPTRPAPVGTIILGDSQPIRIQSMTNVMTRNVQACLEQIARLRDAGCEIVRVAVPRPEDTQALPEIIAHAGIPIVADVHFHYARALEAIEAGVHKIRLNPGNINDRDQVHQVIDACKAHGTAIRIGVNEGSIRDQKSSTDQKRPLVDLMVAKLRDYVEIFERREFDRLVLSAKCHDALHTILVNRAIRAQFNYPIHLGVTHAGTVQTGSVRSATALGALLSEGIGDTIRVSLAGDPCCEVEVAWEILTSLGLRQRARPELIACPTCGRTEIDLLTMVEQVEAALKTVRKKITVAVMGCVVNGPGEAQEADLALCGGRDKAVIYRKSERIATVPADQAVAALLAEIEKMK